ncbi:DUF1292 domain-containing protein [Clostridium beijerinckii]|uniref:DUF1292 domain-containing protein n=1 Tax=Clostridium beijerinckii TaxID=1520 RepID=UPI00156F6042|nr:DUF1292 domain-containing protein [Clostridium beijerinckii]NRU19487.1 uncharacterized protein YrzB (UPF0473 family) [Clostridium beijerinckii]
MDKEAKYVYIPDQEGNDVSLRLYIYFEIEIIKQANIIIATPAFEETDEAYAFKIFKDEDGSDYIYCFRDDDEEFEMVLETYETLMNEDGLIEE